MASAKLGAFYPSTYPEGTMKKAIAAVIALVLGLGTGYAISHGGGLDRNGCHHDHKNGGYHCH